MSIFCKGTIIMITLQVTCVHKLNRTNPNDHITHLGGPGWHDTQQAVINAIDNMTHAFYVNRPQGDIVWLETAISRFGNKYVKTEADGDSPNNLLSLGEC